MATAGDWATGAFSWAGDFVTKRIDRFKHWASKVADDFDDKNYLGAAKDTAVGLIDTVGGGFISEIYSEKIAPMEEKKAVEGELTSFDEWRDKTYSDIESENAEDKTTSLKYAFRSYAKYADIMREYEESLISEDTTLKAVATEKLGDYFEEMMTDDKQMTSPYLLQLDEAEQESFQDLMTRYQSTYEIKDTKAQEDARRVIKTEAAELLANNGHDMVEGQDDVAAAYAAIIEKYQNAEKGTNEERLALAEEHFGRSFSSGSVPEIDSSVEPSEAPTESPDGTQTEETNGTTERELPEIEGEGETPVLDNPDKSGYPYPEDEAPYDDPAFSEDTTTAPEESGMEL